MRKLKAKVTIEPLVEFRRLFSLLYQKTGVDHAFIPRVRWWQFWRWHLIGTRDYVLSRANEIITIECVAIEMRNEIDRELANTCSVCKERGHYPVNCPEILWQCGGCKIEVEQKFARGVWSPPKPGQGSRYRCPECAE